MGKARDHASQLWDRGEECRALATRATNLQVRTDYLQLANLYLELAAREEDLARRSQLDVSADIARLSSVHE